MKNTLQNTCLVLPFGAKIDESLAAFLLAPIVGNSKVVHFAFCKTRKPSFNFRKQVESLVKGGDVHLVDVYPNKYHGKSPSASQMVVDAYPVLHDDPVVKKLVDLVNENNQTGFLKSFPFSIAKILRKIYYSNGQMRWEGEQAEDVLKRTFKMFSAYFLTPKRKWEQIEGEDFVELRSLIKEHEFNMKADQPFTIPHYLKMMFVGGKTAQQIKREIVWWMDLYSFIKDMENQANEKFYSPTEFPIHNLVGVSVELGNQFETDAFANDFMRNGQFMLSITRQPSGKALISASFKNQGVDLSRLFETLDRAEPGKWYLEKRFRGQFVMNGSPQFPGVHATKFTLDELQEFCQKHVAFRGTNSTR